MNILAAKIRDNLERYGRFQLVSSDLPWLSEMFAALDEREKLRELALALVRRISEGDPLHAVFTIEDSWQFRKLKAALQPTPEETK